MDTPSPCDAVFPGDSALSPMVRPAVTWRTRGRIISCLAVAAVLLCAGSAGATEWYIDGRDGLRSNPGGKDAPFKFVWQAMQHAQPGDTVHVLPTTVYPSIWVSASGSSEAPITLVGEGSAPNFTRVAGDGTGVAIRVIASFVVIRMFDVTAPGPMDALQVAENVHDVTIANNVVHDAGGSGIVATSDDHISISHNVVYRSATGPAGAESANGITVRTPHDTDLGTGAKIIVDGNVVFGNINAPDCIAATCAEGTTDAGGSGIAITDSHHSRLDNLGYRGRIQVSNNLVFGNGGRGIDVYRSDHVMISGNTLYANNQDPYEGVYHPGEVSALFAGDVLIAGNILTSDGGTGIGNGRFTGRHVPLSVEYCADGAGPIVARDNIMFSPDPAKNFAFAYKNTNPIDLAQNRFEDPHFVHPSLDPADADFRVNAVGPSPGVVAEALDTVFATATP